MIGGERKNEIPRMKVNSETKPWEHIQRGKDMNISQGVNRTAACKMGWAWTRTEKIYWHHPQQKYAILTERKTEVGHSFECLLIHVYTRIFTSDNQQI